MPILGIMASSVLKVTNSYESIATVTIGSGGSATATFSSIPGTYKHLQIRSIARSANAALSEDIVAVFNSDTGSNYTNHLLVGNGSTAAAYSGTSQTYVKSVTYAAGATASANIFGGGIMDILDYTNTNKYTTTRALIGMDLNSASTTAQLQFFSALWLNTSAITNITIKCATGANISEYSSFALYGIKG